MEQSEYELMHTVEDRMWWYRGLRTLVADQFRRALKRSTAAGPVLDAGCGTGGMLRVLGDLGADRPTMGLEFNALGAVLAQTKARRPVASGSVNEMPIADEVLGGYLSLDVLCHGNVDPESALAEAYRCLAPGAIAIFNLPAYNWLLSAHDRRVHNVRRFERSQARALLARHGFRVLRASYWNSLLLPLMLLHRLVGKDDAQSDVRDYPRLLDAMFSAALAVERAVIGLGVNLPFGGSLLIVASRESLPR